MYNYLVMAADRKPINVATAVNLCAMNQKQRHGSSAARNCIAIFHCIVAIPNRRTVRGQSSNSPTVLPFVCYFRTRRIWNDSNIRPNSVNESFWLKFQLALSELSELWNRNTSPGGRSVCPCCMYRCTLSSIFRLCLGRCTDFDIDLL